MCQGEIAKRRALVKEAIVRKGDELFRKSSRRNKNRKTTVNVPKIEGVIRVENSLNPRIFIAGTIE